MSEFIKIRHFHDLQRPTRLTLVSRLDEKENVLRYGFSLFNPNDKQWIKKKGVEQALTRLNSGNYILYLDPQLVKQRNHALLSYLILSDVLYHLSDPMYNKYFSFFEKIIDQQELIAQSIFLERFFMPPVFETFRKNTFKLSSTRH